MATKPQRELAEQFIASLAPPTTPALKGAARGIASYDLARARKVVKFLKNHVEDLRARESKAIAQYDGHKELTTEILDHISVRGRLYFYLCLVSLDRCRSLSASRSFSSRCQSSGTP